MGEEREKIQNKILDQELKDRNFVLNLLSSTNCICIPILFLKLGFSISECMFLYALIEEWKFWMSTGIMKNDVFPTLRKTIKEKYFIEERTQSQRIKDLTKKGLISTTKKGIPPKTHYKINWDLLKLYLISSAEDYAGDWESIGETVKKIQKETIERAEYDRIAHGMG